MTDRRDTDTRGMSARERDEYLTRPLPMLRDGFGDTLSCSICGAVATMDIGNYGARCIDHAPTLPTAADLPRITDERDYRVWLSRAAERARMRRTRTELGHVAGIAAADGNVNDVHETDYDARARMLDAIMDAPTVDAANIAADAFCAAFPTHADELRARMSDGRF